MPRQWSKVILIVVIGFAVYANSLNGKFIWDDYLLVRNNEHIDKLSNFAKFFTLDTTAGSGVAYGFYRPLQLLSYALNYSLWGINVGGYHLTNTILHILVALCVFSLARLLFLNEFLALLSALLFLVHPVQTEAVAYISGRADSLAAIFLLLSLIFYIKYLKINSFKSYFLILINFALALLSKENSLALLFLILLYHYVFKEKINPKKILSLFCVAALYIILRTLVIKGLLPYIPSQDNFLQRIPGFFVAVTDYIKLLILPFGLHMEYGNWLFSLFNPKALLGLAIFLLPLAAIFKKQQSHKLLSFALGWFFITLLPVSNVIRVNLSYMMEHWLYLPSIGFFLILSGCIYQIYKKEKLKILAIVMSGSIVLFYALLTVKQNNYWHDDVAFYETTVKYKPNTPRIYYNLGLTYGNLGRYKEAIQQYQKALELNPNYFLAQNNIAVMYYYEKQYTLAIKHADQALKLGYEVSPGFLELLKPYRK